MNNRIKKQIKLLKREGFTITDDDKVLGYLEKVGYNRLFFYFKNAPGDIDRVLSLYIFDKRLRLLSLDMLEVLENALKSILIYQLGDKYPGNFWYLKDNIYHEDSVDSRLSFIEYKIGKLKEDDARVKDYFLKNPRKRNIPDYLFFDKLTFGEIIKTISDLTDEHKKVISNYFGIPYLIFLGWINRLKYFRNLCSHYENIFNRKMTYAIKSKIIEDELGTNNTFVSYFAILSLFNKILIPNFNWDEKVIELMEKFDVSFSEIGQQKNLPSELQGEAWKVLVNSLYGKYIKKSKENVGNIKP